MKYYNRRYLAVVCVALAFILTLGGCKSKQKVATVEAGTAKAHQEFFDSMQEQAFDFQTMSARMQVELNFPKNKMSSRVDMKIIRDTALLLSVQPFLGIEAVRVEMTKDSILIVDRLNKRYVAEKYADLKGEMPITFNFYNLQALFINRIFLPGEQDLSRKQYAKYSLKHKGNKIEAKVKDSMGLLYSFTADGEEKLLTTHISEPSENYSLLWTYTDFRLVEKQPFPMLMDVQLQENGVSVGGMKMNFSRIQTELPLNIGFSVPEKYKRISFAQIMKSLK